MKFSLSLVALMLTPFLAAANPIAEPEAIFTLEKRDRISDECRRDADQFYRRHNDRCDRYVESSLSEWFIEIVADLIVDGNTSSVKIATLAAAEIAAARISDHTANAVKFLSE